MSSYGTRYCAAIAMPHAAAIMQSGARRLGAAAGPLHAIRESRRIATAALGNFATQNERDLLVCGFSQADARRVAWGASTPRR